MEAARLGLHDYGQLGGLGRGLLEPWLAPPLSTLSHALPGFLAHPQAAYASYLTAPSVTAPLGLPPLPASLASASASYNSPPLASTAPVSPATSDGRVSPGGDSATVSPGGGGGGGAGASAAAPSSLPFPLVGAGGPETRLPLSLGANGGPESRLQLSLGAQGASSPDPRLSSINSLRLRAKEQMEILKENCFSR